MEQKTKNADEYLKTKVLTAAPEQLQLMLYDGALRFCEQARHAIQKHQIETSYNLICKAEKIVLELCNSMKDEIAPDICTNMRRLYVFCYEQLVEANMKKELKPLEDAIKILQEIRETWIMLMDKLRQEKTSSAPQINSQPPQTESPSLELAEQHVGATINFEG